MTQAVPSSESVTFVGSCLIPVGLFWYGWSVEAKTHWVVPNLGIAIFGAGAMICMQCMQTYIIDSYTLYAASGLAAGMTLRSLAGFGLPLFAPNMYDALGCGWGNSAVAFAGMAIGLPAQFSFWFYGERLRKMSGFAKSHRFREKDLVSDISSHPFHTHHR